MIKHIKIPAFKDTRGALCAVELKDYIDWPIKRVYYVCDVTEDRGGHAVIGEKKIYVCIKGTIKAKLHDGKIWREYNLKGPEDALIVDETVYRDFTDFSKDAVLMAISNMNYEKDKYIYDFNEFIKYKSNNLKNMIQEHILITGGAGFIGSNFLHYYSKKYPNRKITVLDKLTYAGNISNIKTLIDDNLINFVEGDIADKKFIDELFSKNNFTKVINFAAESHVDRSIENPEIFVQTNIIGTHNLLSASHKFGNIRYHQVSTDEVYGDLGINSTDFFTEDSPITPNCPYATTKACADLLVESYYKTYKMPVTISRCSNNYGPYQFLEKLIPYFFKLASENKPLPVYGDGMSIRDWLFVEDHCIAIDVISSSDKYGEVYNISGNNEYNTIEITKFILKFLGKSEDLITFVEDRKAHDRRYAMDASKIKKDLLWEPSVKFEDGIKKTLEWYKNNTEWIKEIELKSSLLETVNVSDHKRETVSLTKDRHSNKSKLYKEVNA